MNLISPVNQEKQNRSIGVGLAMFIVLYLAATICFIILA